MKNISIWKDTLDNQKKFFKLNENREADVLIIGGGITGVSSFYQLSKTSLKTILVEQNKIGMGVTSNSTGKLSFMQNDLIDKIRSSHGDLIAKKYLKSQIEAINLVVDIIKKEDISCDLVKVKSSIYTNKKDEITKIKDLEKFLSNCKFNVYKDKSDLIKSKYMISSDDTYLFHPLKFVYGLIKESDNIYENTSIINIKEENDYYLCFTKDNVIKAKWVIIASHYPYFNIPFMFPFKSTIEKSFLSASLSKSDNVSLISYSNPFISIRNYHDYLIYLSNSHLSCKDIDDKKNFLELEKKLKDLKLKPLYLWSNSDVMTNDYLPFIGEIKNKMLIATGYNTWGLASSVLSSKIICDIIMNKKNEYIDLFDPNRTNVDKILKSLSSIYHNIEGFCNGLLKKEKKKIMKCPHMKCTLIYNEVEKTYDCPCHGSRFNSSGKCISGPSNKDIKI